MSSVTDDHGILMSDVELKSALSILEGQCCIATDREKKHWTFVNPFVS